MANLFATRELTRPMDVYTRPKPYDASKTYDENVAQQNTPTADEIIGALNTPQAKMQRMQNQIDQQAKQTSKNTGNGTQGQPITNADQLAQAMGYTSPEQEEKLRKASVANQRILAFADAIRHIGNIASTINYAPAQQFNNPVLEEQARYENGKAVRDKANYIYLNYMQQKAKQEAQQRQWAAEQKQKADQWNANFKWNAAKFAAEQAEKQRQYNEGLAYRKQNDEANRKQRGEYQEKQIALGKQRLGLGWANHNESVRFHNETLKQRENRGSGRAANGGYVYATKNGSVTLPKDYLSKNRTNRTSILKAMRDANFIDDEWEREYENAAWTGNQYEMLDDVISDWLQNDDDAELWMIHHLGATKGGGSSGGSSAGSMPGVTSGSANTMPGVGR